MLSRDEHLLLVLNNGVNAELTPRLCRMQGCLDVPRSAATRTAHFSYHHSFVLQHAICFIESLKCGPCICLCEQNGHRERICITAEISSICNCAQHLRTCIPALNRRREIYPGGLG
jgi:hypothetical protein